MRLLTFNAPRVHFPVIRIGDKNDDKSTDEYHEAMADVKHHIKSNPETWRSRSSLMAIIEMEYSELMTAKSDGSKSKIERELAELAAACVCELHRLKSMK